jgi:hypothetical protein
MSDNCTWGAGRESSPLTRGGGATSSDNGGRFMSMRYALIATSPGQ